MLAAGAILNAGTEAEKQALLPGIAAGDTYTCSFTAEVKRSDLQELQHENTVTAIAVDNDSNSTPEVTADEILQWQDMSPGPTDLHARDSSRPSS